MNNPEISLQKKKKNSHQTNSTVLQNICDINTKSLFLKAREAYFEYPNIEINVLFLSVCLRALQLKTCSKTNPLVPTKCQVDNSFIF